MIDFKKLAAQGRERRKQREFHRWAKIRLADGFLQLICEDPRLRPLWVKGMSTVGFETRSRVHEVRRAAFNTLFPVAACGGLPYDASGAEVW